jgi:hypothetical protein
MPRADQLPEDLRELVYRNAVELTHARWDSDVDLLIKALKQAISVEPQPGKSANVTRRSRLGLALFAGASLIAGISYMAISFRQKVAPRLPPTAVAVAARDKNPAGERETPKSPSVRTASTEEISTKVSVISYVRDGTNDHGEFRRSGTVWAETFSDLPAPRYWTEVANPPSGKLRLASGGAFIEIDLATKAIDYSDGTSPLRRLDTITSVARE